MATVLVVDDEFGILQVLAEILIENNYEVLTAINGRQALERLKASHVDVVLTDYMMPTLDGPGLINAMAAEESLRSIPVVVMSSFPPAEVTSAFSSLRFFLRKPFRVDALLEVIATALDAADGGSQRAPDGT